MIYWSARWDSILPRAQTPSPGAPSPASHVPTDISPLPDSQGATGTRTNSRCPSVQRRFSAEGPAAPTRAGSTQMSRPGPMIRRYIFAWRSSAFGGALLPSSKRTLPISNVVNAYQIWKIAVPLKRHRVEPAPRRSRYASTHEIWHDSTYILIDNIQIEATLLQHTQRKKDWSKTDGNLIAAT